MAATILPGSTSVTFGAVAESGVIINSFSATAQSSKSELMDNDGDIVAVAYYGKTVSVSVSGAINGSGGVADASVGASLTLANSAEVGGISGGTIVTDSVAVEAGPDSFKTISVEATLYPELS